MNDFPQWFYQRPLQLRYFPLISYDEALQLQLTLVAQRQRKEIPDTLLLLEHQPVITLGRRGLRKEILVSDEELQRRGITIEKSDRGGQTTFHGPGQLVGYIIADLGPLRRRLRRFIELVEESIIATLADFDIVAHHHAQHRGVWTEKGKIAAIGISMHQGVSMHGFALNVSVDLSAFRLIIPCGLQKADITSMEQHQGSPPEMDRIHTRYADHFSSILGFDSMGTL